MVTQFLTLHSPEVLGKEVRGTGHFLLKAMHIMYLMYFTQISFCIIQLENPVKFLICLHNQSFLNFPISLSTLSHLSLMGILPYNSKQK